MSSSEPLTDPWSIDRLSPPAGPGLAAAVSVVVLGTFGPFLAVYPNGSDGRRGAWIVLLATALGEASLSRAALGRWRFVGFGAAVVAGELLSHPFVGRAPMVVASIGLFLAHAAVIGWRRGSGIAFYAVLPVALAGGTWWHAQSLPVTVALYLVAMVMLGVHHRKPMLGVGAARVVDRVVGTATERLVDAMLLFVALPIVYLPGAIARAISLLRGTAAPRWATPASAEVRRGDVRYPFIAPADGVARRRHLTGLASLLAVLLVAFGINRVVLDAREERAREALPGVSDAVGEPADQSIADRLDDVPFSQRPAMAGLPFADELQEETLSVSLVDDEALGWSLGDRSGELVNIKRKVRASKLSSCRGCPTTRLILAGGSAVFGVGQRDEQTIASALVDLAAIDGVNLDVVNRGVPGWTLDQERIDIEAMIAANPRSADVVVFLDGFNDGTATLVDALSPGGVPGDPARLDQAKADVMLDSSASVAKSRARDIGVAAAERYRKISGPLDGELEANGVAVARFFQPDASSSAVQRRAVEQLGALPEGFFSRLQLDQVLQAMADELAPEVHDLRGIFDDVAEPVYLDLSHVNEEAAASLAEAIYAVVRADVVDRAR